MIPEENWFEVCTKLNTHNCKLQSKTSKTHMSYILCKYRKYQYFCLLHNLLHLLMKRTAGKKWNFTECITSARFSNSARTAVITHSDYLLRLYYEFITCSCNPSSAVLSQSSLIVRKMIND